MSNVFSRFGPEPAPPPIPRFAGEPVQRSATVPDEHVELIQGMHDTVARMAAVCPGNKPAKGIVFLDQHVRNLAALHNQLVKMGAKCPSSGDQDEAKARVMLKCLRTPRGVGR
jgi:hypothetical protein